MKCDILKCTRDDKINIFMYDVLFSKLLKAARVSRIIVTNKLALSRK